jgi:integrase/recombinase XerD
MSVAIDATRSTAVERVSLVPDLITQPQGNPGFDFLVEAFLSGYSNPRTQDAYRLDLRHWKAWCAEHRVDPLEVRRAHIDVWVREMEQAGGAPRTINRRLTAARSFYRYCVAEEFILRDPTTLVKGPKVPDTEQRHLALIEMKKFLDAAKEMGPKHNALACLLFHSGLRISEACDSMIENLGENEGMTTLRFMAKGGNYATVKLAPKVAWAIRSYIGERESGPIFLRKDGNGLDRRTGWFWVQRSRARQGSSRRTRTLSVALPSRSR